MAKEKMNPYNIYLGNLFTINENGIGEISEIKYAVIKRKENFFSKPKFISYPGEQEVLVGSYDITINDKGLPFLINAVQLHEIVGWEKISSTKLCTIIIQNNDPKKLKTHI